MPVTPTYRERFFGNLYFGFMEDVLDALYVKRMAISKNIANINNPNYHPIHVEVTKPFEKYYQELWNKNLHNEDNFAMEDIKFDFDPEFHAEGTSDGHAHPIVTRTDGKVDLNYEMGELYKTQLQYNAVAENGRPSYGRDVLDQMLK